MTCIADTVATMFLAWNATSEAEIRAHAERALAMSIEFVDADFAFRGLDDWSAMVVKFRRENPGAKPGLASEIDVVRDRARYIWRVRFADGQQVIGEDVIAFDTETCKINRIDSFYGRLSVRE